MTALLLLAAGLAAQMPEHHEVPAVTVDLRATAERLRRLEEAKLLEPPQVRRRNQPIFALSKERPRPGKLVNEPKPLAASLRSALAIADLPAAVSPDTPRSLAGFPALDDNLTAIPPDTHGAVGPNHVMTVLNSEVQIQNRQGLRLSRVVLEDFWRAHSPVDLAFDPRLAFDARNGRWVFCVLAEPQQSTNALYVGVSQTADPMGQWNLFRIPATLANSWMDYPTMAISGPWVLITLNNFSLTTDRFVRSTLFVFTAADLYQGRGRFRTFSDLVLGIPVEDASGSAAGTAALVASADDDTAGEGLLRVSELRGEPGAETFNVDAARLRVPQAWRFSAVEDNLGPQQGTNFKLDLGDDRMQQCVLRGGTTWCVHTVFLPAGPAPTRSAIQVLELTTDAAGAYRLARQSRIEDSTGDAMYAYPGIAVNKQNDVLVGYSRFSARQFPSANFSFRAAADPPGQFQADAVIKRGEGAFRSRARRNRWGDYSVAQVDPVDDLSLWTIQEYGGSPTAAGTSRWSTWWAAVTPHASACSYTLGSTTLSAVNAPATATVAVRTVRPECRWMAASNVPWITVSGSPGQGDGTATLAFARNSSTAERRGTVTIAGQDVTVTQQAGPAAADLVVTSLTAPTSVTLGRTFDVSAEVRNVGSLPATAFRIGFFVSRRPEVTAGDVFTGFACNVGAGLAAGQATTCAGAIQLPLELEPELYHLAAIADFENRVTVATRETTTRVADTGAILVQVSAEAPAFVERGVVHGATGLSASVTPVISPGQVVVIYGNRLGPPLLVTAELQNGRFPISIAGTSVRFDGVPAPMLYASSGQLAVMAPFGLSGTRTRMQIVAGGLPSEIVTLAVTPLAPGLFTTNFSGTGQAAVLNQDSTVNSRANPAARGSVVQIYATGLGALVPPVPDGSVVGAPLPALRDTVRVDIGGRAAQVLYAGPAPGLVAGVMQVNALIAADALTGDAVVRLTLPGDVISRAGTTIAVR